MNPSRKNALNVVELGKRVSLPSQDNQTNELTILEDINFKVEQGESVAIVGASGSGKSTLLSLLAGLDLPSSGDVEFFGQSLAKLDEEQRAQLRRTDIGFIFQQFLLIPSLTALENVMLPAELSDNDDIAQSARKTAAEWLAKVGLSHRLDHYPNQLSGGEQQRVAIARAFITAPKLLFADEPSANLDTANGEKVEDLLFELNQSSDTTLILVTHDPKLAKRCERTIQLDGGKVIDHSQPDESHFNSLESAHG